jgi:hypothetical protein
MLKQRGWNNCCATLIILTLGSIICTLLKFPKKISNGSKFDHCPIIESYRGYLNQQTWTLHILLCSFLLYICFRFHTWRSRSATKDAGAEWRGTLAWIVMIPWGTRICVVVILWLWTLRPLAGIGLSLRAGMTSHILTHSYQSQKRWEVWCCYGGVFAESIPGRTELKQLVYNSESLKSILFTLYNFPRLQKYKIWELVKRQRKTYSWTWRWGLDWRGLIWIEFICCRDTLNWYTCCWSMGCTFY